MKSYRIRIVDTRTKVGALNTKRVSGFRVHLVAKNGEMLAGSEALLTYAAVKKNIEAMGKVFAFIAPWELYSLVKIEDKTKAQIWETRKNNLLK